MTIYEPTPIDIAWAKSTVNLIRDGGVLAFPSTQMIFTVNQRDKTLTLMNPIAELRDDQRKILNQSIEVFKAIDWQVK